MAERVDYHAYLLSESWRLKRGIVIRLCGFQCQRCGRKHDFKNRLQVHHYTYERLGNENLEDLVALCKSCHKIADKERITNPTKRYKYERPKRQQHD